MIKKLSISLVFSLILALMLSNIALAAQGSEQAARIGQRGYGEIVQVTGSELVLKTPKDKTIHLKLDGQTVYRDQAGNLIDRKDLQVGQIVGVIAVHNSQDGWTARLVIVLPDDFDPSQRYCVRAIGRVIKVDVQGSTFTLHTRQGNDLTFLADSGTQFRGEIKNLKNLEESMVVAVASLKRPDSTFVALAVWAHTQPIRMTGVITDVNVSASKFSLRNRQDEEVTFRVDKQTRFISREGVIGGLKDLDVGMIAIVVTKDEDGTRLALKVASIQPKELPRFDHKFMGRVMEVNEDSFILKLKGGDEVILQVTEETRYSSRGGWVQKLEDLKSDMLIAVCANESDDGSLEAQIVLVVRRPSQ